MRSRVAPILPLMAVVLASACAQPMPSPTRTPSPVVSPSVSPTPVPQAHLQVTGQVREQCGSLGGCAYFVHIEGAGGAWDAEFDVDKYPELTATGLPDSVPVGTYEVTMTSKLVSDAITNGQRQIGPVDATCSASIEATADRSIIVLGAFDDGSCEVLPELDTFKTGEPPSPPPLPTAPVDPAIEPVSRTHPSREAAAALKTCGVIGRRLDQVAGVGRVEHATDVKRYARMFGTEPELKTDAPAWVIQFEGRVDYAGYWADNPVCVVIDGRPSTFAPEAYGGPGRDNGTWS